jgi:Mrp family chromosome partitioning ATPase
MDLRRPMLASYLGLPNKGCLTDYLAETGIKIEEVIVPSGEHKNLDLIPCGTVPPNPAELLQTDRAEELFAELRKRYDYILVDTAPLALASDAFLLDRIADLTIIVSRFKYTPYEMIEYVNRAIEQKRLHNVVCLLNGVKGLKTGYEYGQ